jgi:hypothetical protein
MYAQDPLRPRREPAPERSPKEMPVCDICGSSDTRWVKCKLICRCCRTILMSCEDV